MPTVLRNILSFRGLAIGVPSVQAHGLNIYGRAVVPHDVRANNAGYTITADDTNVTVTRTAAGAADVDIECIRWHSIEDAEPQPGGIATSLFPFIVQGIGTGGGGGGVEIAAGTQTAATGTIVLSDSNGVAFGMSGSSQITASVSAIKSLIAAQGTGTTSASGPSISFVNGNGVTFGINGNTITASVQTVGGTATGVGISAGTETAGTGVVVFSNLNGITFGMQASTVTATYQAIRTISASGGSVTNGQISFANSNSVTFGINAGTLTASINLPSVQKVVAFTATGGETDFNVTMAAVANTNYAVIPSNAGVASIPVYDCPKTNRSLTAFRVIPSAALVSNDVLEFYLFAS